MAPLRRLDPTQDQLPDTERPSSDVSGVVASQRLEVLCRVEESDVACLVELIDGVLERRLVALLVVGSDSWGPIV